MSDCTSIVFQYTLECTEEYVLVETGEGNVNKLFGRGEEGGASYREGMSSATSSGCLPFHEVAIPESGGNRVTVHINLFLMGGHSSSQRQ